jgi:hypothetical protein
MRRGLRGRAVIFRPLRAILYGAPIGTLGGLIGLGGAEFRLPVLRAAFGYATHRAVALNLAVSLLTSLGALVIRVRVAPTPPLVPLVPILVTLIAGSIVGAYRGAAYASRLSVERLERLILVLLVAIGQFKAERWMVVQREPTTRAWCSSQRGQAMRATPSFARMPRSPEPSVENNESVPQRASFILEGENLEVRP